MSMERPLDIVRWLASPRPCEPAPDFSALIKRSWREIDALVGANRIGPLLHHLHGNRGDVPAATKARWAEAHRVAALDWRRLAREFKTTVTHLRGAGSSRWCSKACGWRLLHTAPALRPMRDFDLLVPAGQLRHAIEILSAAGYA